LYFLSELKFLKIYIHKTPIFRVLSAQKGKYDIWLKSKGEPRFLSPKELDPYEKRTELFSCLTLSNGNLVEALKIYNTWSVKKIYRNLALLLSYNFKPLPKEINE